MDEFWKGLGLVPDSAEQEEATADQVAADQRVALLEGHLALARLCFAVYTAFVQEGFSPLQAFGFTEAYMVNVLNQHKG